MLRKITIAVDCADDQERHMVQDIMAEISGMGILSANSIIGMYPFLKANRAQIFELFGMVSKNGIKSIINAKGISMLTQLTRR
jgi:hypothetical protein